jgi:N-acetyl-gamma-glutamyl-phosphate reductase
MKVRAAIVGGSGYTGVELLRILALHPEAEVTAVTSRQYAGKKVTEIFPSLHAFHDLEFITPDTEQVAADADVVFTAVPHQTAMSIVPGYLEAGCRIIDLSADFRIRDRAIYEKWYQEHSASQLLKRAVYGLPEIYGREIAKADLTANPGCYPTSTILPLYPLLREGVITGEGIIVDSKSGTSGAGRGASVATLYCEVNESFKAYKLEGHRHTPEIEQELSVAAGRETVINFTPHLVPMNRGILTTSYSMSDRPTSTGELLDILNSFYRDSNFVNILPEGTFPSVSNVRGSNFCDIGIRHDERTGRVIAVSVIDNLVKGASGQAVQNMNIMFGLAEETGLRMPALYP